jgi:formylglycine-generating enzyme required for sulfatase activity
MKNETSDNMMLIAGGTFLMGSDQHYSEERPAHRVTVDSFWIDQDVVTNADFAAFIAATGYVTFAERPLDATLYPGAQPELLRPGSAVFCMPPHPVRSRNILDWWQYIPGADWRHPEGPASSIVGREREPVVHVALADAVAYATWVGKDLPTEAEWEFAARGGLDGAEYCWGNEFNPNGRWMANTWQGEFPWQNHASDDFVGRSPVGSFPANGYGLFDMAGNVWQWTKDWYAAGHTHDPGKSCCVPRNPRGVSEALSYDPAQQGSRVARKVIKGGSYLCAPNYCRRYRPAARYPQTIDTTTSHIGFRCVLHTEPHGATKED